MKPFYDSTDDWTCLEQIGHDSMAVAAAVVDDVVDANEKKKTFIKHCRENAHGLKKSMLRLPQLSYSMLADGGFDAAKAKKELIALIIECQ